MDKADLLRQLTHHLKGLARAAGQSAQSCAAEARNGASPQEKTVDSRVAMEYAQLARGQKARAERATNELRALDGFTPRRLRKSQPIEVGSLVEIEDSETGEGRTFFLAPVGAGVTLTGPDGDGHLSVVTPTSPMGRATLGRCVGDVIDLPHRGGEREWTIVWAE